MSFKKVFPYALTAMLTLATACGGDDDDDTTGPSGDSLTTAEFTSMTQAMAQVMLFAPVGFGSGAIAAQTSPVDETIPCPQGGTVRFQGTVGAGGTPQAPTVTMDLNQAFNGCKASGEDGTLFTFSGTPTLDINLNVTQTGGFSISFQNGGNIGWATGSKEGTCGINTSVTATATANYVVTSGNLTGTMCGRSVNVAL